MQKTNKNSSMLANKLLKAMLLKRMCEVKIAKKNCHG